ncbi:MAG: ATP-dependent acyl-CoA ligase [Rhodospirillales bacterium]
MTLPTESYATVHQAFVETAGKQPDKAWLAVPALAGRDYHPDGFEMTYGEGLAGIEALREIYAAAGFGLGHRVALMLDNRPDHFLHLWALNGLGVSVVPVNGDYLEHELAYLLEHSDCDLALGLAKYAERLRAAAASRSRSLPVLFLEDWPQDLPAPERAAAAGAPRRDSEAAVIYTSGTTGRPKGCLLDNDYFFAVGIWYAQLGGRLTLQPGRERLFVPLPVFHVNAGVNTPTALILTANCLILPDRFHPKTWWRDLVATKATGCHYLGVVPPILLKAPPSPEERAHSVAFGLGAGLDPRLHRAFEERFGIPMVEVWGMTETGRFLADAYEPRRIETRAFGRPTETFLAKVADDEGREVPRGTPGELLVRWAGDNPRKGFFTGYLKDPEATEAAWKGGWFHSGDLVVQDDDGMLIFVERKKNVIRRSGENISAAEVENGLIGAPQVAQVAVMAVEDPLRDEEVMAIVVAAEGHAPDRATAEAIFTYAGDWLSYHKLPGWILFLESLPTTGTQKIAKHQIFGAEVEPTEGAFDLRDRKKRKTAA